MKQCKEVMTTNPVCCLPSESLSTVAKMMRDDDIGSVPVIESEQSRKLIGIVTDRDLVVQVMAYACDPKSSKVSDVMTRQIYSCHVDDDLMKAVDTMAEHQLRRLPVVDLDGRIVGIISQADIAIRVDQPEETGKLVRDISVPTA